MVYQRLLFLPLTAEVVFFEIVDTLDQVKVSVNQIDKNHKAGHLNKLLGSIITSIFMLERF